MEKESKGGEKGEDDDILDVGVLEKKLDKKYSSLKSNQQIKNITKPQEDFDDN